MAKVNFKDTTSETSCCAGPASRRAEGSDAGFTILELMVAILVISAGVIGAISLIEQTLVFNSLVSSKFIAGYLAQEGIEIVRNIRDGNWLEQRSNPSLSWDEGIAEGEWEADYRATSLNRSYSDSYLNIYSEGFYGYSFGTPAKFKRKITISEKRDLTVPADGTIDAFKVSTEVSWRERGKDYKVNAEENLYNWR